MFFPVASRLQAQQVVPEIILVNLKNGSDSVQIYWKPTNSKNVSYYIIRTDTISWVDGWTTIKNCYCSGSNSFTFKYPPVLKDSVSFRMRSIDTMGQSGLHGNIHTSNFLKIIHDNCHYTDSIWWTGYRGWGDSLAEYQVWVKEGNRAETLYKHTPSSANYIVYPKMLSDTVYYFVLKAIHKNGQLISYSNRCRDSIHIPKTPSFINADYASDASSGGIEVSFSFDSLSELDTYSLFRSETDTAGPFLKIQTFDSVKNGNLTYIDAQANPLIPNYYKLAAQNTCFNLMKESSIAGNIVLNAKVDGNQVFLSWNKYKWWAGGAGNAVLMRSTPVNGWETAAYLTPSDTTLIDKLDSLAYRDYKDKICYYLKASEDSINKYGLRGISLSNIVCMDIPSAIIIPNAFTPNDDGKNDEFLLTFNFIPDEFLLKIFDRNGNLLFQSVDVSNSWNGRDMKGRNVPQGTYVYYLRYRFQGQSYKEFRGPVSVLYP